MKALYSSAYIILCGLLAGQAHSQDIGRYQVISGSEIRDKDEGTEDPGVWLLDTQSGRIAFCQSGLINMIETEVCRISSGHGISLPTEGMGNIAILEACRPHVLCRANPDRVGRGIGADTFREDARYITSGKPRSFGLIAERKEQRSGRGFAFKPTGSDPSP